MKWRWLAVPAGGAAVVAMLASLPSLGPDHPAGAAGEPAAALRRDGSDRLLPDQRLRTVEMRQNRQRITTVLDDDPPPMVVPAPGVLPPATVVPPPPRAVPPAAPAVQPVAAPPILLPPGGKAGTATVETATLRIVQCLPCRGFVDDHGRRWQMIQGRPGLDQPPVLAGWLLTSYDTPPFFYSIRGNLYRMLWQSRPPVIAAKP
ncbi:MAG: hypothetical protein U0736_27990 [Gemmataceae bacterium]